MPRTRYLQFADGGRPMPVDEVALAVLVAYTNDGGIADMFAPKVKCEGSLFKYLKFEKSDFYRLPDTRVGRTSRTNRVGYKATEASGKVFDEALDYELPLTDEKDKSSYPQNQRMIGAEMTMNDVQRVREKRVADLAQDINSYDAAQVLTLSGTDQFDDYTGTPYTLITSIINSMLVRPNIMTLNAVTASVLAGHPDIATRIPGSSGAKTPATMEQLAALFGLQKILIGDQRANTAQEGQTPVIERLWGNNMILSRTDPNPSTMGGTRSFMISPKWRDIAVTFWDPNIGVDGADVQRIGESITEIVTAPDHGYFVQDVLADPTPTP